MKTDNLWARPGLLPIDSPEFDFRYTEQTFRALIDQAPDAIFVSDQKFRIIEANTRACEMSGYSREEVLRKSIFDFIVPEDVISNPLRFDELTQGKTVVRERRLRRKDGTAIPVEVSSKVVSDGRLQAIVRDVRHRQRADEEGKELDALLRQSDRRFRALIENSQDAIALFGADGAILYASPSTTSVIGFTPEELLQRNMVEFIRPDWHDRVLGTLAEVLDRPGVGISTEAYVRHKDGEYRFLEGTFTNLLDEPSVGAIVNNYRDVTERKRAEEELRATTEQLRALSARLLAAREEEGTRIAREIHDELGGVLTGLKWDIEDCEKALSASTNAEPLGLIRKKIPVMTGLLDNTIDTVRRISSELRPGVLDDLGLVAAIEWQAQQFQQRTGIECRFNAGLATIDLNRDQATAIFRVFQEVLTNVIRHAQATRIEITVSEVNKEFVLEVKDNGRGISESERQNMRSLGLLGMHERVQLVGGKIEISGAQGQGTRVVVRVPLA